MGEVTNPVRCAACNAEVPPGFRFCGHCGAPVVAAAAPAPAPTTRSGQFDAERRQITVLFCDLAGSTKLAERLDLEDLRDVVRAYQQAAVTVIERFGGHVAQYLGDGILAYFGYPEAREDDARRAVRAALEVVRSVELLNNQIDPKLGVTLGVRVAAHTGLVVTGEVGSGSRLEDLALGPTPNIAARLQEEAAVGTAVIGDTTYHIVRGFFECEALGPRVLKGRAEPMPVYRVLRETSAKTLFDVAVARGLSMAVGRTSELEILDADFARAASGSGCAVLIRGEPGIGKSRLIRLFRERRGGAAAWVTFRCSSDDRNSALRPVIHVTERAFRFASGDTPEMKLKKLIDGVAAYGNLPADAVPLLAALLGIPVGDAYPPLNLGATLQRTRTQEVLLSLVLDSNAGRPVVLVVEDAHWADSSTVELLAMASARLASRRVLLLATARPEFVPSWIADSAIAILGLDRLGARDVEALATSVAGGKALPSEVLHQLASKADGVPLFVEEMTKLVLESGMLELRDGRYALREPLGSLSIPATLQDSLLARLDRLGPAKGVAQLASVIGRQFTLEMLRCVWPLTAEELDAQLRQLVDAGMFDPPEVTNGGTYLFRHALTQDAAYQSLLKNTRRRYHQTIAVTFAERFPEVRQAQPELFGAHYAAAGMPREAVTCLRDAITHAMRLGNAVEGVAYCREAIAVLGTEPASDERNRLELALQVQLGDALSILHTYASADAAAAFERARALAGDSQEVSGERFGILSGLYRFYWVRGDTAAARGVVDELLAGSARLGPLERVIATYSDAFIQWNLAGFRDGLPRIEAGLAEDLAAWGPPEEGRAPQSTGLSGSIAQGVQVRCTLRYASALNLTHLGDADRAIGLTSQSIAMARQHRQTYSEAMAYYARALIHYLRRDPVAALPDAMNCVKIAREHGHFWAALGSVLVGWGQAFIGGPPRGAWPKESVALIEAGLGGYRRAGAHAGETVYLTLLAEIYLSGGDQARARQYLDESLAGVKSMGEVMWLPEIHRQAAALARARGDEAESREELRRGAEVARAQGNVLMEEWLRPDLAKFG
jgi:class 3 adenylate cyclase/tetratricopeptide (TPR) repeat protein